MAITKLADLIVPEVFGDYLAEKLVEESKFIKSGVVVNNPLLTQLASGGGNGVNVPFYKDLAGEEQVWKEGVVIEADKITAGKHYAPKIFRAKGWGADEFAAELSGTKPLDAVMTRIARFYTRVEQRILLKILDGAFSGPLASSHKLDVSGNTDGSENLSNANIISAAGKLGDAADQISTIAMNSVAYQKLQKDNLIEFVRYSEQNVMFPTYLGYRIIVDDAVPYDAANGIATIYLFANGAVSYANVPVETPAEVDRDSAASTDYVYTRTGLIMHVNGLSFTDGSIISPTNSELATGSNWEKVYEDKNIGVVSLICKV